MPSSSEVSTRLTADNSQFRSVMNETERVAERAGKSIFKKLDLRIAMYAVASAIGLNIQSIAENLARVWSGVSKELEEAYKRIDTASKAAADNAIADLRDQAKEETKLKLLLLERERIQKRLAAGRADPDAKPFEQSLLSKAMMFGGPMLNPFFNKGAKMLGEEAGVSRQADALEQAAKLSALNRSIRGSVGFAGGGGTTSPLHEKLFLEAKKGLGILSKEESDRLKIIQLQTKEMGLQVQINELLVTSKERKLTPAESAHLRVLIAQTDQIKKQIGLITNPPLPDNPPIIEQINSYIAAWEKFVVKVSRSGRGTAELSDRELERKLTNINKDIFQMERSVRETGVGGQGLYFQRLEQTDVLAEQNLRRNVRRTAATQGEDAAFNQFGGLTEQRFADILKGATDQSQLLTAIDKLSKKFDQPLKTIDVSQASPFG